MIGVTLYFLKDGDWVEKRVKLIDPISFCFFNGFYMYRNELMVIWIVYFDFRGIFLFFVDSVNMHIVWVDDCCLRLLLKY